MELLIGMPFVFNADGTYVGGSLNKCKLLGIERRRWITSNVHQYVCIVYDQRTNAAVLPNLT